MNNIPIYEFDKLVEGKEASTAADRHKKVPRHVYQWLDGRLGEKTQWLRPVRGHMIQVTNYVGVIREPNGYQIEVLPKIGSEMSDGGAKKSRKLLLKMLRYCEWGDFKLPKMGNAHIQAVHNQPLWEIFIGEFLRSVKHVVKRGLRSDYVLKQGNLFALRGKLLMAQHLRHNLCRADRFFTEYDEFSTDRPANRLLHAALKRVLSLSSSLDNQRLARELRFVFADVPLSTDLVGDFRQVRVRFDRGMSYYTDALAWARLILEDDSPLTGVGQHDVPSLLFPMEKVFESFVAKKLKQQLKQSCILKSQASYRYLVRHQEKDQFLLKPDLLIRNASQDNHCVLDTKWKLLDISDDDKKLSQSDFYQLYAYGQNYLDGKGVVALIYPKTDKFNEPLPVFQFKKPEELRLWALPFCLECEQLLLPEPEREKAFADVFKEADCQCH